MRIAAIGIQKFRSIDSCWIETTNLCALVGSNNVGKSTLMRALNAFFNFQSEQESFLNRSHDYSNRGIPKIDIVLTNVSNKPIYICV